MSKVFIPTQGLEQRESHGRLRSRVASVDVSERSTRPTTRAQVLWADRPLHSSRGRCVAVRHDPDTGSVRVGLILAGATGLTWLTPDEAALIPGFRAWRTGAKWKRK